MAAIYFKRGVKRLTEKAYHQGILDGVKLQKGRGPKPRTIEVKHVIA